MTVIYVLLNVKSQILRVSGSLKNHQSILGRDITFNVSTILVVLMPIPILSKNHCVYDINDYANANSLEERSGAMAHNNAIS